MLVAIGVVSFVLAILPGRTRIAPLVESDYCYQLAAADRMLDGKGLTAGQPVAPFQPWDWTHDWGFLTNWPAGYSLLIVGLRRAFQVTTLAACGWINIFGCATAVVGWFVWTRRLIPRGVAGVLVSAVAAGCAVSVGLLINPSTDVLLVALAPIVMLLTVQAIEDDSGHVTGGRLAAAGLLAGGLFWIRYASIFLPFAVAAFLLLRWRCRRLCFTHAVLFGVCAAAPILALLGINRLYGPPASAQAQLNLGHAAGFDLSWPLFARAWWMFSDLGYYEHRVATHWMFALWPAVFLLTIAAVRRIRAAATKFLSTPPIALSCCTLVSALAMLIAASTLFRGKFDYVGLERYYLSIRPLYFALFVAPLALLTFRGVRLAMCMAMVLAGSWTVGQEWSRTYGRWLAADRPVTPFGQWSRCFEPGAAEVFRWLRSQNSPELVVVSNFHEYIALETGIAALPIPPGREALHSWLAGIRKARDISETHVVFVLDPDNRWRDHWILPPQSVITGFALKPLPFPPPLGRYVYAFDGDSPSIAALHCGGPG
jgi:hypothetical protein